MVVVLVITLSLAIFAVDSFAKKTANLLTNPGAETGSLSPWVMTDCDSTAPDDCFKVNPGTHGVKARSGNNHFGGDGDDVGGAAKQVIDLSQYATYISAGSVKATFSGYMRGIGTDARDFAQLKLNFLRADGSSIGTEKETTKVKATGWTYKDIVVTSIPKDARKIEAKMYAGQGGSGGTVDGYFDDLILTLEWSEANSYISPTSLKFGDIYCSKRNGAKAYNEKQTKTITIKNSGDKGSVLDWKVTGEPSSATLSKTSGRVNKSSEEKITVWVNPASSGSFSSSFKINDTTISLSATVYDTPKVTPASDTGSNNKVNMGPNDSVKLKVKSGNPTFPEATIKEYEWQDVQGDTPPDTNRWAKSKGTEKEFLFSQSVIYTVYCRMVDSNGVATDYTKIPIRVWKAPDITGGAGTSWYGMGKYFVGVVNQPLLLQAEADLNGNKAIAKYVWKENDEIIAVSPGGAGLVGEFFPISSTGVSSYNLTNFESYVSNNDISPDFSWVFETVEFPESSGTFKHATQKDVNNLLVDTGFANYFFAKFSGFLNITTKGNYYFHVKSDDGFRLRINNTTIAQYTGTRAFGETSGSYNFSKAGFYPIELVYFGASGSQGLELRWQPPSGGKAIIPKSAFSEAASYIPRRPNLSGKITCQAFTSYGIPSKEKSLPLKIYELLGVEVTGDTTGSPNRSVSLVADIPDRDAKYPGYLRVAYGWAFTGSPEVVKSDNKAEVKWNDIGKFKAEVTADLLTKESLSLKKKSKPIIISVSPFKPTALPNGPYSGGIAGGNYSPIQFEGNSPDYIEAPEVGKIKSWEWAFLCPSGGSMRFNGVSDYCKATTFTWKPTEFTVSWWLNPTAPGSAFGEIPGPPDDPYFGSQSIGGGDYPAWGAFQFNVMGDGSIVVGTDVATTFNEVDLPESTVDFNQWQHFTFTFDNGEAAFYKNGVKLASKTGMTMPAQWNGFWIGCSKEEHTINGKVDDVAIWNRAIEPGEVSKFIGKSPEDELDCIAFWDFNDNEAPEADKIELDDNLTILGSPSWLDSGQSIFDSNGGVRGGALRLDGVNDHVQMSTPFNNYSNFTIALWANPDALNDGVNHALVGGDDYMPSLQMTSNGGLYYSSFIDNNTSSRYDGTINNFFSEAKEWVHIAWVKSGTSYKFYLNGYLQTTTSAPSTFEYDSSATYYVGRFNDKYWDGHIDEVCIWNTALSDSQVEQIKNNPREYTDGLGLYWNCEEGVGTTALDQSKAGKDGVLYNGATWLIFNQAANMYNPTFAYAKAGTYTTVLRVRSEYNIWSDVKKTKVTVIDGEMSGLVKAADLRTPVKDAKMTLFSSHVDPDVLSSIANEDPTLFTASDGGIYTLTDESGAFTFKHLPLGSYRLVASKVENGKAHEFENPVQTVELSLESPNKYGILYVDISVFPISGRIVYSLQRLGQDVFVKSAVVKAQPAGNASPVQALPSAKSPDATGSNYNLPLFAGRYMFIATRGGHDVQLNENSTGYDKKSKLVTIKNAVTDIDFIDYTTREVFVYVEDSGGFPIDTYQSNKIKVQVNGDNGFVEEEVITKNKTYIKATVPPGKYTVSLPDVPTAYVKGDTTKKKAEVLLEGEEAQSVTMVVPVPIVLEISAAPKLLDPVPPEFLETIGLTDADNPEGYMIYYPPKIQTHTYTIKATANSNPVADFTLRVIDNISQLSSDQAAEITYPDPSDKRYSTDEDGNGLYKIAAGLPKASVVDENDPSTYMVYTLADGKTEVKVPIVLPKGIRFQASKDGYEDSTFYTREVTVLGDISQGSESELVAVPNVNYFVLHDPPGDSSYSYLEDSMTIKGIITDMQITVGDDKISVYPSPWSVERKIDGVNFESIMETTQDLGDKGLLGYHDPGSAGAAFGVGAAIEAVSGALTVALGPIGYAIMAAKVATTIGTLETQEIVQYEISPTRYLETNAEDETSDLNGPGKGDLYHGEGWTLALQTKYRLGIKKNPSYNSQNPDSKEWIPDTAQILTYDIMERNNQYIYTVRDIEKVIADVKLQIADIGDPGTDENKKKEKKKLESGLSTWQTLLKNNPAYTWQKDYVKSDEVGKEANRENLEKFMKSYGYNKKDGELLIFSSGTTFEYSRRIGESRLMEYSTSIDVGTEVDVDGEMKAGPFGAGGGIVGVIARTEISFGFHNILAISTNQSYGTSWESGTESEQTVGFVLSDDDIGDNISTYVFDGPWGTPIFFTDPGSVTSDPWQAGTNKGVDLSLSLIEEPTRVLPFDYHDGAHYRLKMQYTGVKNLEVLGTLFEIFAPSEQNPSGMHVALNGDPDGLIEIELDRREKFADVIVSLYPPEVDRLNADGKQYSLLIEANEVADPQIMRYLTLTPEFADLRAPRATITAPYNGQRISPAVFTGEKKFEIQAFSDDHDVAKVQIEIRSKQTDGVWEPWRELSGMVWADPTVHSGATNSNVTIVTHSSREPVRREFTFAWSGSEITNHRRRENASGQQYALPVHGTAHRFCLSVSTNSRFPCLTLNAVSRLSSRRVRESPGQISKGRALFAHPFDSDSCSLRRSTALSLRRQRLSPWPVQDTG